MASAATNGKRLCVIGAGPSGTAQLRSFKTLQDQGVAIPQIVCFEKQAELGGSFDSSCARSYVQPMPDRCTYAKKSDVRKHLSRSRSALCLLQLMIDLTARSVLHLFPF